MKKVTQSGALPTAGSNRIDLYSQSVGAHSSTFVSAGRGPILKRRVDPSLPVALAGARRLSPDEVSSPGSLPLSSASRKEAKLVNPAG